MSESLTSKWVTNFFFKLCFETALTYLGFNDAKNKITLSILLNMQRN